MSLESPARAPERSIHLTGDEEILLLSDLHLGDGGRTDLFCDHDAALLDLLDALAPGADAVVLNGDVLDATQAGRPERIRSAHGEVLRRIEALARGKPVLLVAGNHDLPGFIEELLPSARVCMGVALGDRALVVHGHQFDIHFDDGPLTGRGRFALKAHSLVERLSGQFIRLPFGDFDNPANRFAHWAFYRLTMADLVLARLLSGLGRPERLERWAAHHDYWARSQWGDSQAMLLPALAALAAGPWRMLIIGHSHQAGLLRKFEARPCERVSGEPDVGWRSAGRRAPPAEDLAGRTFANLGSWTLGETTYGLWSGGRIRLLDWTSGREVGDRSYRMNLTAQELPGMREWWERYYRGCLRYDTDRVRRDRAV